VNDFSIIHVRNDQHSTLLGRADDQKAMLFYRMIWVIERIRKRITKQGCCFLERDTVFGKIASSFLIIPFKPHG